VFLFLEPFPKALGKTSNRNTRGKPISAKMHDEITLATQAVE
jgi:hypothetical protein